MSRQSSHLLAQQRKSLTGHRPCIASYTRFGLWDYGLFHENSSRESGQPRRNWVSLPARRVSRPRASLGVPAAAPPSRALTPEAGRRGGESAAAEAGAPEPREKGRALEQTAGRRQNKNTGAAKPVSQPLPRMGRCGWWRFLVNCERSQNLFAST